MCGMKASVAAPTLPFPNPDDWCTLRYACKRLNRSERTVRRMIAENVLRVHRPRVATDREQADMFWLADVEELREAFRRAGTLIKKTGWRE
jgi:excisionase family DNA binding protein